MTPHQDRAAILTAWAQDPSPTALPPVFAGIAWHAHNLAAEAVCDLGEAAMKRKHKRQRGKERARAVWHSWPAFCARFYARETWRGVPGPLPVKVLLFALAVAEPGPYGEIALGMFAKWNGARKAAKR